MNESDRAERRRSMYRKVLEALDEAQLRLETNENQYLFHLGRAGGISFTCGFPGAGSDALFLELSDAVERRDAEGIERVRQVALARSDPDNDSIAEGATASDEGAGDWISAPMQWGAALNEARLARREGDERRSSLMLGFVSGLMFHNPGYSGYEIPVLPPREGTILDGLRLAYRDDRDDLLEWAQLRLAGAHRHTFWAEDADFPKEERSVRGVQNFGARIGRADADEVRVPTSYVINRALVLQSREEDEAE